ncbi:chymotrypsinogen B-like [Stylophora pistillata]|uniref:chymotrypsinogen B-like n=1 Tax=Stylophora pistillata TaxID=50429 RepID=UPI000C04A94A|nr:chymotrypsinogen B-like [Stylophora pistillata]
MNLWIGVVLLLLGVSQSLGCGQKPFSARVVNGDNASPNDWPWQISLRVNGQHICGGSLIEEDWVVTAAHCVERNPSPSGYTVVVRAHARTGTTYVQQTFRLRQLFKHEGFDMGKLQNDIALLQVNGRVRLSDKVNTVCMPQKGKRVPAGSRCYITGWGRLFGGGQAAYTLQQAVLQVVDHGRCQSVNGYMVPVDEDSMVCAEGEGKGGCQENGDSGGPFVCNEGGRWVLRGAVSWGHGKCRTDHYTVFASVSNFVDWIKQKQSSGGGGNGGGGGGVCPDKLPNCSLYQQSCRYSQYIQRLCPKSCRLC